MTDIGPIIAELEHVWQVRCGKCGATQILTVTFKADAEYVLKVRLRWTKKVSTGWRCPNCGTGGM